MHQKVGRRGVRKARLCDVRADWLGWAESLRGQLYLQCSWRSFLQWGGQDRLFGNLYEGEGTAAAVSRSEGALQ